MIVVSQKKQKYYLKNFGQRNKKICLNFLNHWICVGKYESSLRATQVMMELYDAFVSGETEYQMPEE